MIKKYLFFAWVLSTGSVYGQVGINNTNPKSTFHVIASKTDGTTAEGIIAPNLTRSQLITKDGQYGSDQRGAIVYVTTIDGTATTKTTNVTLAGYYYFDGTEWVAFRSATAVIPTEPWQVQGSTTAATSNAENIYQTGSVAVGSNSAGSYKFQVTGTSNVTGNSRVGSSTVTGNQTVAGTLGVTGATTLQGTNVAGTFNYQPGGTAPAANTYLRTDASGNASWQALPATATTEPWQVQGGTTAATTNAQNIYQTGSVAVGSNSAGSYKFQVTGASNVTGNSRVASSTVVGNETVGGTLGVTGAATLSNNLTVGGASALKATNMTGVFNYQPSGTAPAANTYLRTDATGNASWQALPTTATTEPWQVQGGTTAATTNAQNIYQTGSVAVGSNSAGSYKFQVTGATNVTGNSRVGSSTVAGNETVAGTLGVTGTSTLTGNVGIGAASNASYKLQVTGASNITGNSRVASSTVVGNETVGGTLGVTGNSTLTGSVGIGTASPAQKLHVVGNQFTSGISKIGGTTTYNTSAQLELSDNNKGFLPNRVALTSSTVKAPVANAVDGMVVYNTATVTAQGIAPGLYYWRGTSWQRLVDQIPQVSIGLRDLQVNMQSNSNDANNTNKGTLMNFGSIIIPEDGSYAFTFRLYGAMNPRAPQGNTIYYYIAMMRGTSIMDSAEMDIVAGSGSVLSYTVTLGAQLKAGDNITFRLSHNPSSNYPWGLLSRPGTTSANRTSMVWWKL